jgi:hypothetical protein
MITITNDPSKLGIFVLSIYFYNKRAQLDFNGWKLLCLDGTFQIKQDVITNETVTMNVHRFCQKGNV